MVSISPEVWTAMGSVAAVISLVIGALAWLRPRRQHAPAEVHGGEAAREAPTAPIGEKPSPKPGPARLPDMHVERPRQRAPLHPIRSGHELVSLVTPAVVYEFSNHEPDGVGETELLAGFLDQVKDWGEIVRELGPGESVRAGQSLGEELAQLEQQGWEVHGVLERQTLVVGDERSPWPAARIRVARKADLLTAG
jgi:hypothetical protein